MSTLSATVNENDNIPKINETFFDCGELGNDSEASGQNSARFLPSKEIEEINGTKSNSSNNTAREDEKIDNVKKRPQNEQINNRMNNSRAIFNGSCNNNIIQNGFSPVASSTQSQYICASCSTVINASNQLLSSSHMPITLENGENIKLARANTLKTTLENVIDNSCHSHNTSSTSHTMHTNTHLNTTTSTTSPTTIPLQNDWNRGRLALRVIACRQAARRSREIRHLQRNYDNNTPNHLCSRCMNGFNTYENYPAVVSPKIPKSPKSPNSLTRSSHSFSPNQSSPLSMASPSHCCVNDTCDFIERKDHWHKSMFRMPEMRVVMLGDRESGHDLLMKKVEFNDDCLSETRDRDKSRQSSSSHSSYLPFKLFGGVASTIDGEETPTSNKLYGLNKVQYQQHIEEVGNLDFHICDISSYMQHSPVKSTAPGFLQKWVEEAHVIILIYRSGRFQSLKHFIQRHRSLFTSKTSAPIILLCNNSEAPIRNINDIHDSETNNTNNDTNTSTNNNDNKNNVNDSVHISIKDNVLDDILGTRPSRTIEINVELESCASLRTLFLDLIKELDNTVVSGSCATNFPQRTIQ